MCFFGANVCIRLLKVFIGRGLDFLRICSYQDHFDLRSVPAPAYYCRAPAFVPLVYTLPA